MAAKKDFSKDAADIFGLRERREMEARQRERVEKTVAQIVSVEPSITQTQDELTAPVVPVVQATPEAAPPRKTARKPAQRSAAVGDTSAMTTKTFRITRRQHKALQMRMAMSDNPAEKDLSSIVRAALDAHLRAELERMT